MLATGEAVGRPCDRFQDRQAAIENGTLEIRRFNNYQKLLREQAFNGATLAEQRAQSRQFGKLTRNAMSDKRRRQQSY